MGEIIGPTITSGYCPICNSIHTSRDNCLVCHRESYLGAWMPYPSRYDGKWICGECIRLIVDPAIGAYVEHGIIP